MPPLRILIPKMRLFGFLPFLVPFIFLGGVQEPGLVDGFFFKACPKVRIKCEVEERNQCMRHRHCPIAFKHLFSVLSLDICSMPKETGPCFAYLPRWWYDKETELCSRFIYGGCQGNPNNFPSEAICLVICKKRYSSSWIG
uniref:BPTI/Kunitz inhibitor domain-containing protein n=1 Tax=Castor canadensis TaxID=51338 RepID=A0A8C0XAL0_CASCN